MAEDWTKFPPVPKPTKSVRGLEPFLVGLLGPPGAGKTHTMLRLMRGVQRVFPGPLVVVDTEAGRSKKYSPREGEVANPDHPMEPTYDFQRIDLDAPFRGDRCWAAIQQGLALKPAALGFDNLSDEHSGEGGYLDWHDKEVERVGGNEWAAWSRPSAARKKLLSGISHVPAPPLLFFTFISEEKTEQVTVKDERTGREKKKVVNKGWIPVAPLLTLKTLDLTIVLSWDSRGTPIWKSRDLPAEDFMRKWPDHLLAMMKPGQVTEDHGEALARWVKGEAVAPDDRAAILAEIKGLLKRSFPGKGKPIFLETFGVPFEKEVSLSPDRLLVGLQALKAKVPAVTQLVPEIVAPEPAGAPSSATLDDTRSTVTIRQAAEAAGLSEERLRIICKGDPEEVPGSPEILEEILEKIRKEASNA